MMSVHFGAQQSAIKAFSHLIAFIRDSCFVFIKHAYLEVTSGRIHKTSQKNT